MGIKSFILHATHVENGVWDITIQNKYEDGVAEPHPHSPFHIRVMPSYNTPKSITGLVLEEAAFRLLRR